MDNLIVDIIELKPMHVVSTLGFGENPEELAFKQMADFATNNGLLNEGSLPETYGFNNPEPSPGSPNYGYELWLPVAVEIEGTGKITPHYFPGGLYAVTRFQGLEKIGETWRRLVVWQERSEFRRGTHQWLEKLINPRETDYDQYVFELYLPIEAA